ncbi:MAG TPA: flagellar assembly protein FliW [Nocardioidaceae bacterium]|nr:flagellar assembly protein FliW [Nocardioidaceae bacterium]
MNPAVEESVPAIPLIDFVRPLPGFPGLTQFALVQVDDDGLLSELRSVEDSDLSFLVLPPGPFFPDYAPEIGDDVVEDLGVTSPDEVIPLVIVNAGDTLATTTVNLLAPVLVNTARRTACQVILDEDLSVRAPLQA